jgi:hypothetical protein
MWKMKNNESISLHMVNATSLLMPDRHRVITECKKKAKLSRAGWRMTLLSGYADKVTNFRQMQVDCRLIMERFIRKLSLEAGP